MNESIRKTRSGFSLVELVIACLLVAAAAACTLPTAGWIMVERRTAQRRQMAAEEVANLMERVTCLPWQGITPPRIAQIGLDPEIERQLPDATLAATVDSDEQAKRIGLALSWTDRAGQAVAPVRLTTWVFRQPTTRLAPTVEGEPQ